MRVRLLGCHHTETATARLTSLLVDDIMAVDAGAITSTLTSEEQDRIEAVLITHHHYDHVRDLLTLALGGYQTGKSIPVYATRETHEFLQRHLLDGGLYPNFTQIPSPEKPRLQQISLEPWKEHSVCGFQVTPIPVEHTVPAVGYHIASPNGDSFFYTGDTNGVGLAEIWESLDPNLVILEVTYPNSQESLASQVFHLTPSRVETELLKLQNGNGNRLLPPMVAIHLDPMGEQDISAELMALADKLGASIVTGHENMILEV